MKDEDKQLRAQIATITDALVSEQYTEDAVEGRYEQWRDGAKDAPTPVEEHNFDMAEMRNFTEELVYRVVRELQNK